MRLLLSVLSCGILLPLAASAQQIKVEVVLNKDFYLAYEELPVGVKIINYSGQTLRLGAQKDWLKLEVEEQGKQLVAQLGEVPVQGEFEVASSTVGTRWINIAPYLAIRKSAGYRVTASVKVDNSDRVYTGQSKTFQISSGARIWEQEFGLPRAAGEPATPDQARKYALIQSSGTTQAKLYVRVSDATESRVYRTFPLGNMVSFSAPETQLDKSNRLHVLNQFGARSFFYCIVSPDGDLLTHRTYDYSTTRPALRADRDGEVVVSGGVRRATSTDLPAEEDKSAATKVAPAER